MRVSAVNPDPLLQFPFSETLFLVSSKAKNNVVALVSSKLWTHISYNRMKSIERSVRLAKQEFAFLYYLCRIGTKLHSSERGVQEKYGKFFSISVYKVISIAGGCKCAVDVSTYWWQ